MEYGMFAQQGWQCPCCKKVYSPTTPMCFYCAAPVKTGSSTDPCPGCPVGIICRTPRNDCGRLKAKE